MTLVRFFLGFSSDSYSRKLNYPPKLSAANVPPFLLILFSSHSLCLSISSLRILFSFVWRSLFSYLLSAETFWSFFSRVIISFLATFSLVIATYWSAIFYYILASSSFRSPSSVRKLFASSCSCSSAFSFARSYYSFCANLASATVTLASKSSVLLISSILYFSSSSACIMTANWAYMSFFFYSSTFFARASNLSASAKGSQPAVSTPNTPWLTELFYESFPISIEIFALFVSSWRESSKFCEVAVISALLNVY